MPIQFKDFSFRYASQEKATLQNINLTINPGEKVLILGPSGSGKSTLGKCLNGLVPLATKGEITGSLSINEKQTNTFDMNDFSTLVGTALQDTDSQFVGLSVAEDIAFALENQQVEVHKMHALVKETSKMVELDALLHLAPDELSGGQKQRVALAGLLVDDVSILLFDEPLANLDPRTCQATIELIDQLHQQTNNTIVVIEHRLEEMLHRVYDRVILMDRGTIIANTTPNELLHSTLLTEYGIREPLYLSALKKAGISLDKNTNIAHFKQLDLSIYKALLLKWSKNQPVKKSKTTTEVLLSINKLCYSYEQDRKALDDISFTVNKGEMISVLGKNGSGKSTLSKLIMGILTPDQGQISLDGEDLSQYSIFERAQKIGIVLQNPNHMISHHLIFDEIASGLRNRGISEEIVKEKVEKMLHLCGLEKYTNWPIEALSYGQKKRVTIASILILSPTLLILDEPTAGQDYKNYTSIMRFIRKINEEQGITVMVISHDMHLVLEYTSRSIVIADSKLIADAPMLDIFTQPKTLTTANLTTTSLYELAKSIGLQNKHEIAEFMRTFISAESYKEKSNKENNDKEEKQ